MLHWIHWDLETVWISIGLLGQGLFFMRFFVQWLASEKAGRSVMPMAFWYFSVFGGATLFAYAVWRKDPVFIIGQSTGLFIYIRNLVLIAREKRAEKLRPAEAETEPDSIYSV